MKKAKGGGFDKFIVKEVKGAKKKEQLIQDRKKMKKERELFFIEKKRKDRAAKALKIQQDEELRMAKKDAYAKKPATSQKPITENTIPEKKKSFAEINKERRELKAKGIIEKPKETKAQLKAIKTPIKTSEPKPVAKKFEIKKKTFNPNFDPTAKPEKKLTTPGLPYLRKPVIASTDKKPLPKLDYTKAKDKNELTIDSMPLNKYLAHCGVASRRDAADIIKTGKVKVNDAITTEPGFKVKTSDYIMVEGKKISIKKNLVYILLNKPKDFLTTTEDDRGRKTVLDLIKHATEERVYPVGRLDRNTSGVLLLTNDGDLANQLTHPKFQVRKLYEAKLDKPLTKADFDKLLNGITLEDGEIHADVLAYADDKDKSVIGIEIHSGRNRIVRRMFEQLGYDVKGLDRVIFANLTKKNVERGKWRFLSDKEVRLLKFFNKAKGQ